MVKKKLQTVNPATSLGTQTKSLFHLLLATRTCAVLFSNVWDCDETYNYFEPIHFLIYGYGCQTWEYAPNFGLRSYAYLLVNAAGVYIPAVVLSASKIFVFYMLRYFLAFLDFWSIKRFCGAVTKQFGSNIGDLTLLIAIFSPGYFQSSTAFLPSSTVIVLLQYALASFLQKEYVSTALCGAVSAFLVWPFSAALYLPAALAILFDLKLMFFSFAVKLFGLVAIFIVLPVVSIDTIFYGKFVAAAYNIFVYNFLSVDENRGSHLYGTAPLSYYLMNIFLNFNVAAILSLIGAMALFLAPCTIFQTSSNNLWTIRLTLVSTLILWLGIFLPQPHKEERFLYPIYPLICFTAATGVQALSHFLALTFRSCAKLYDFLTDFLYIGFVSVFVVLSLSRCVALYFNYHASMDIYLRFSESVRLPDSKDLKFRFCVGREWHHSPGHFLLNDNRLRLEFIESAFEGLLPGHYFENMTIANATRADRFDMNDMNVEEKNHYVPISSCHFLADINMESTGPKADKEPNYAADTSGKWRILVQLPYLAATDREDVDLPAWKMLHKRILRAFYVPYFSNLVTSSSFRDYVVLQNTDLLPLKIVSA